MARKAGMAANGSTIPEGQLTGSLKQDDVHNFLLPAFAALMNDMLQRDPKSPVGKLFDTGGTFNPDGSVAQAGDGMIGISDPRPQVRLARPIGSLDTQFHARVIGVDHP